MRKPPYWDLACSTLAHHDPIMQQLIQNHSDGCLMSGANPLATLARAIVGQQISVKAADSIWIKLNILLGEIQAQTILQATSATLRSCGLSEKKVSYLQHLAQFVLSENVTLEYWQAMDEKTVIDILTAIKGIGPWTAQMFLIFYLQRPNIYPIDDIGLQKAVARHYNNSIRLNLQQLQALGERWHPWRTVASWYLWRSLDPLPVAY